MDPTIHAPENELTDRDVIGVDDRETSTDDLEEHLISIGLRTLVD